MPGFAATWGRIPELGDAGSAAFAVGTAKASRTAPKIVAFNNFMIAFAPTQIPYGHRRLPRRSITNTFITVEVL
jgi:hypothetical protein